MRCNECIYYSFLHDECRRHAPSIHNETGEARWPTMTHHEQYEWCGEFLRHDSLATAKRVLKDPAKYHDEDVDKAKEQMADWESR